MFDNLNGGQPPNPRDLTHFRHKHVKDDGEGPYCQVRPHAYVTCFGARVASQQLPYPPNRWDQTTKIWMNGKIIFWMFGIKTQNSSRSDKDIMWILVA